MFKRIYHTKIDIAQNILMPSRPNILQVEKCADTLKLENMSGKNVLIPPSQKYSRRQNVLIPSFCILLLQTTTSRQLPDQTLSWLTVPRRTFPRPNSSLDKYFPNHIVLRLDTLPTGDIPTEHILDEKVVTLFKQLQV